MKLKLLASAVLLITLVFSVQVSFSMEMEEENMASGSDPLAAVRRQQYLEQQRENSLSVRQQLRLEERRESFLQESRRLSCDLDGSDDREEETIRFYQGVRELIGALEKFTLFIVDEYAYGRIRGKVNLLPFLGRITHPAVLYPIRDLFEEPEELIDPKPFDQRFFKEKLVNYEKACKYVQHVKQGRQNEYSYLTEEELKTLEEELKTLKEELITLRLEPRVLETLAQLGWFFYLPRVDTRNIVAAHLIHCVNEISYAQRFAGVDKISCAQRFPEFYTPYVDYMWEYVRSSRGESYAFERSLERLYEMVKGAVVQMWRIEGAQDQVESMDMVLTGMLDLALSTQSDEIRRGFASIQFMELFRESNFDPRKLFFQDPRTLMEKGFEEGFFDQPSYFSARRFVMRLEKNRLGGEEVLAEDLPELKRPTLHFVSSLPFILSYPAKRKDDSDYLKFVQLRNSLAAYLLECFHILDRAQSFRADQTREPAGPIARSSALYVEASVEPGDFEILKEKGRFVDEEAKELKSTEEGPINDYIEIVRMMVPAIYDLTTNLVRLYQHDERSRSKYSLHLFGTEGVKIYEPLEDLFKRIYTPSSDIPGQDELMRVVESHLKGLQEDLNSSDRFDHVRDEGYVFPVLDLKRMPILKGDTLSTLVKNERYSEIRGTLSIYLLNCLEELLRPQIEEMEVDAR